MAAAAEVNLKKGLKIKISIPEAVIEYVRKVLEREEKRKIKHTLEEQNKALIRDIKAIRAERNNLIQEIKHLTSRLIDYDMNIDDLFQATGTKNFMELLDYVYECKSKLNNNNNNKSKDKDENDLITRLVGSQECIPILKTGTLDLGADPDDVDNKKIKTEELK